MATPFKDAVLALPTLVTALGMDQAAGNEPDLKGSNNAEPHGGLERAQASLLPNGEGKSAKFNGTTGYFSIPDNASLDVGNNLTVGCWVKLVNLGKVQSFFDLGSAGGPSLIVNSSNNAQIAKSGVAVIAVSTTTVDTSAHLVIWSKVAAASKIYIDGIDRTGAVTDQTISTPAVTKLIGQDTTPGRFLDGFMQYPFVCSTGIDQATATALTAAASQSTTPGSQFPLGRRNKLVNP